MRIKELRESKNMTQKQLGAKIGVTPKAVSWWELGVQFPNARLLPQIAKALGCRIEALFEEDDLNG